MVDFRRIIEEQRSFFGEAPDVFDKMKALVREGDYCDIGKLVWAVEECIKSITRKVGTMGLSAASFAPQQQAVKQEQKQFLHGSDCKDNKGKLLREVTLQVTGMRTAPPGFNAPLIMDFVKQFEKESLPLNKTNIRALGALIQEEWGDDDLERAVGHSVLFQIVSDKNPNSGEQVPTLRVASGGLIKSKAQPKKK